jgi:branched-chain amino acid transport system substrate-binding protein
MQKRQFIKLVAIAAVSAPFVRPSWAATMPGITDTEILIGNTNAYSGRASAFGVIAKTQAAYFDMVNAQGGINGRKIRFLSYDDGYSPPRTLQQVRRLVEQDQVAFLFQTMGTPTNSAIQRYANQKKVPHLFVCSGADKWANYEEFPWTIAYQPSLRLEARIYAKYLLANKPNAKLALLYQNDDFGKDYLLGVQDVLGDKFKSVVVAQATYEVSDPTIESQIVSLKGSGADALISGVTPKFGAQVIRKVADLKWNATHFISNTSITVGSVIEPAGKSNAVGIMSAAYSKEQDDPAWKEDPGMNEWRAFMATKMPGVELRDNNVVYGYGVAKLMADVLKTCGKDLSREHIMKQVTSLKDYQVPTVLPGITASTSSTDYRPMKSMQLQRWNGEAWQRFGALIDGGLAL